MRCTDGWTDDTNFIITLLRLSCAVDNEPDIAFQRYEKGNGKIYQQNTAYHTAIDHRRLNSTIYI